MKYFRGVGGEIMEIRTREMKLFSTVNTSSTGYDSRGLKGIT